jgi:hypothetical protein
VLLIPEESTSTNCHLAYLKPLLIYKQLISVGLPVAIYRAVNAPLNSEFREVSQKEAVYLKHVIFII